MKCAIMMNTEDSLNIYYRREMCSRFNENACGIHVTDENWERPYFCCYLWYDLYNKGVFGVFGHVPYWDIKHGVVVKALNTINGIFRR